MLRKTWNELGLVRAPKSQRLPDSVTVEQLQQLLVTTRIRSYRVLFFTLYSLGLRLGGGLRLQVGDIDADRQRVHIRNAKGNEDRLVPLPQATLSQLRDFWRLHRHPTRGFPKRRGGLKGAAAAASPLDRGGVQTAFKQVVAACGLNKDHAPQPSSQLCLSSARGRCRLALRQADPGASLGPDHRPPYPSDNRQQQDAQQIINDLIKRLSGARAEP